NSPADKNGILDAKTLGRRGLFGKNFSAPLRLCVERDHVGEMMNRRSFVRSVGAGSIGLLLPLASTTARLRAMPRVRVTGFELLPVRATERTVWLMIRLRTDAGLTGLGEASDAFGFANTSKQDAARMESELRQFFALIDGKSPLDVEAY